MTSTVERSGPASIHGLLSEDSRWYVFGDGDNVERLMRVSTALELVGDHDGRMRWATLLSADTALEELPTLVKASRTKDCGNTWKRCDHDYRVRCADCPCGQCMPCVKRRIANRHYGESSRRSEEGTRVHDWIEHWVLHGGEARPYEDDIAVYIAQFEAFVADYGLTPSSWEMSEATVINREYGYAGTLDGILRFDADATEPAAELVAKVLQLPLSEVQGRQVRLILDCKSREKEEARLFSNYSLQQAGYRHAEVVRLPDGSEVAMPATDGAVILQLRPDGYLCRPVMTDERTFGAFLSALSYAKWHWELATASVSSRAFPVPKEPKPEKPAKTAKSAPAKTASAKAAKTAPASARKTTAARKATAAPKKTAANSQPAPLIPQQQPSLAATQAQASAALRSVAPANQPHPPYDDEIPF